MGEIATGQGTAVRTARRVLIAGLSTCWGGRLAKALERVDEVEAIVGVDSADPTVELGRTEFVRVSSRHELLRRILGAARIDTVVDIGLLVDSGTAASRGAERGGAIETVDLLAACSCADSPVRRLVFCSSADYYGCAADDPAFFAESMPRAHPPATPIEREVVEAEVAVAEHAERHPDRRVTVLRFADALGPSVKSSQARILDLPLVPVMVGFDPRCQFIHEDDVVGALEHAATRDLRGIYNIAADGVLARSEVISLLGKRPLPLLPPWGARLLTAPLRPLGLRIPDQLLRQLRFGRGLDNRLLKATGFDYRYTTREAVLALALDRRLHPALRDGDDYPYEREAEDFLRRSHLAERPRISAGRAAAKPGPRLSGSPAGSPSRSARRRPGRAPPAP